MPRVHLCRVLAQHWKCSNLIAWKTTEMTFSLDTYADIIAELRHTARRRRFSRVRSTTLRWTVLRQRGSGA